MGGVYYIFWGMGWHKAKDGEKLKVETEYSTENGFLMVQEGLRILLKLTTTKRTIMCLTKTIVTSNWPKLLRVRTMQYEEK